MSLVSTAEVRARINTSLGDVALQAVIDRIEAEITARIGAPQDDTGNVTITRTVEGEAECVFMPSGIASIVSIVEWEDELSSYTPAVSEYRVWSNSGVIERLPEGTNWEDKVVVVYKPQDDRLRRAGAILDLVRLDLNRTAMVSESVAGEYSYTAPANWEKERRLILRRLAFPVV